MNAPTQNEESQSSFAVPLFIGLIIGILVGAPIGVLLMKRKKIRNENSFNSFFKK